MNQIIANINVVKIIVFITLLFALFNLKRSNLIHRVVLGILWVDFITEVTTLALKLFNIHFNKVTAINICIEHCLWLFLLGSISLKRKTAFYLICIFLSFGIINFLFIQGKEVFNYYTFILGAFLYITFFFVESFVQLEQEKFEFVFSNNYLLLSSPILFLFGVSLMFAFVSGEVTQTIIFKRELFSIVIDYVNIVCYLLISIYIYKETKIKK